MTATLETFTTSITSGNIVASQRPARTETSVSSSLAFANLVVSRGSRTNARTTRMPVICSRSTRLTSSIRSCTSRKLGTICETTRPTQRNRVGTTTASSQDRPRSSRIAITTPPTIMIGTETAIVQVIRVSIWTCWMSLVLRVISDGAPKVATSRPENDDTFRKTAERRSRPNAIAVRDANHTAITEQMIWIIETPNITMPRRMM